MARQINGEIMLREEEIRYWAWEIQNEELRGFSDHRYTYVRKAARQCLAVTGKEWADIMEEEDEYARELRDMARVEAGAYPEEWPEDINWTMVLAELIRIVDAAAKEPENENHNSKQS